MKIEDFTLNQVNEEIPWRLFTPEQSTKEFSVLWLQGWSSSMDSHREAVERMAKQSNTVFATLDYAGHGLHKLPLEKSTRKQQHEGVVAIFDELKKRNFDNIIVIGGSFGGYMTALLTAKRPVHTAVLRAPANYPDDEFELPYAQIFRTKDYAAYIKTKDSDVMLFSSSATRAIQSYDGFVYILEHELDELVPSKVPKRYMEVAKHGNYLIIPKTKHSPKLMNNPVPHFVYIEYMVMTILNAVKIQETLRD
ncbi:MAG: alpha/beta hydrolase [Pseudomonadota bacterium]|nr:alpha/beta hydrolase [Pseudomonadota bacterium]